MDAIKQNLIPKELSPYQTSMIYASEADVLNVALFGIIANEWRAANTHHKGNMRDEASINQLICLANMENLNAVFIQEKLYQKKRLIKSHCHTSDESVEGYWEQKIPFLKIELVRFFTTY